MHPREPSPAAVPTFLLSSSLDFSSDVAASLISLSSLGFMRFKRRIACSLAVSGAAAGGDGGGRADRSEEAAAAAVRSSAGRTTPVTDPGVVVLVLSLRRLAVDMPSGMAKKLGRNPNPNPKDERGGCRSPSLRSPARLLLLLLLWRGVSRDLWRTEDGSAVAKRVEPRPPTLRTREVVDRPRSIPAVQLTQLPGVL